MRVCGLSYCLSGANLLYSTHHQDKKKVWAFVCLAVSVCVSLFAHRTYPVVLKICEVEYVIFVRWIRTGTKSVHGIERYWTRKLCGWGNSNLEAPCATKGAYDILIWELFWCVEQGDIWTLCSKATAGLWGHKNDWARTTETDWINKTFVITNRSFTQEGAHAKLYLKLS